jgi:flavin reductase (DIM6/NTAB) family NADH-FMN oxidoreductase RutF
MSGKADLAGALRRIPYGLYVVGSLREGVPATMIANWVTQVSFHPPCVAIAVESASKMRGYIEASNIFCVNILPAGATTTAKAFLKGPEAEKETIGGERFTRGKNGTPFLAGASASIECRVLSTIATGDHVLFVGEVVDAALHQEGEEVLTLRETGWKYSK